MERATKNVRLGLTLPIGGAELAAEQARAARARGYEELWLAEVGGGDAYAIAGALAVSVPGMRIGTAVVPAQTRTPMVHAMAAMSLSQLTGGNFILEAQMAPALPVVAEDLTKAVVPCGALGMDGQRSQHRIPGPLAQFVRGK